MLRSLALCNAKRCPETKTGCVSTCISERSKRFMFKSNSASSIEGNANIMKSPRPSIAIEDYDNKREQQSQHPWNRYIDMEFDVSASIRLQTDNQ